MTELRPAVTAASVGALLQSWRKARQLSQLALSLRAEISSRHLCFIETGRAKPSRDMVLRLATTLDMPLRERNQLLLAAGFAPFYPESKLEAPALGPVKQALDAILNQQEPYPAVVMNRRWDLVASNRAAARFFGFLLGKREEAPPSNVLRLFFHHDYIKPFVENWLSVAQSLLDRARREALAGTPDAATQAIVDEVTSYPGVPRSLQTEVGAPLLPVLPVVFVKVAQRFQFFSAVTTLGTAQDVTLQELRIESFFPVDAATAAAAKRLSESHHEAPT